MSWGNSSSPGRGRSPQRWGNSSYGGGANNSSMMNRSQQRSTSHTRHHSPATSSRGGYQTQWGGGGGGYNSVNSSGYSTGNMSMNHSMHRDTSPQRPFSSPSRNQRNDYSFSGGMNHSHGGSPPQPSNHGPPANNSPITQVPQSGQQSFLPQLPPDFIPPEPDPSTFTPLLPPKSRTFNGKNTLVLDLDETLVHSSFKPIPRPDIVIDIELDGQMHTVYVRKRPFVEEFLARMSQLYEVVILTASLEVYADPLINRLDRGNWCHHRLFRDSCANLNGNYIKDLSYLGRPLHQTIIIDNSPTCYLFQPRNALPISSWFEDPSDRELWDLLPALERAAPTDNIYPSLAQSRSELQAQQAQQSPPPSRQW